MELKELKKIEEALETLEDTGIKCPNCDKSLNLRINFTLTKENENIK